MFMKFVKKICFFIFLWSGVLNAHQLKEAYSTLKYNSNTNSLEIEHRFYVHDSEHALSKVFSKPVDLHKDAESKALFEQYILSHFSLWINDELIQPDTVGSDVERKYFWVYQEVPLSKDFPATAIETMTLEMTALQDVWKKQLNYINVELNDKTQSVRLSFEKPKQTIAIKNDKIKANKTKTDK